MPAARRLRMTKGWAMRALGWSEVKTRLALGELERAEIIQRLGENAEELQLRLLQRRFPPDALRRITEDLARQRKERYRRLDEMTDYCKTHGLPPPHDPGLLRRPRGIRPKRVFCCDNCERPRRSARDRAILPAAGPVPMPAQYPRRGHPRPAARPGRPAPVPGPRPPGQTPARLRLPGHRALQVPGPPARTASCAARPVTPCTPSWTSLIEDGLLRQGDEDDYFTCAVTQAGRAAWQEQAPLSIPVPGAPRPIARAYAGYALSRSSRQRRRTRRRPL